MYLFHLRRFCGALLRRWQSCCLPTSTMCRFCFFLIFLHSSAYCASWCSRKKRRSFAPIPNGITARSRGWVFLALFSTRFFSTEHYSFFLPRRRLLSIIYGRCWLLFLPSGF